MAPTSPIVGSIIERKPGAASSKPPSTFASKTGFPAVQHRSKSAFARSCEERKKSGTGIGLSKLREVPTVVTSTDSEVGPLPTAKPRGSEKEQDWREKISQDNEERVSNMTEEEREEERREVLERFGANIGDVLKRARLARERQKQGGVEPNLMDLTQDGIPITSEERRPQERARSPPHSALVSPSSTRPSSRADRRLRFAELGADDVHVYESAPSSPKRKALALPPPDPNDQDVASLGSWKGKMVSTGLDFLEQPVDEPPPLFEPLPQAAVRAQPVHMDVDKEPEEGSAEYIRQRYFPDAPKDDPNLAWFQNFSQPEPPEPSSSSLRFDLQGNPISATDSLKLPSHLGLHHHAEGTHAGYTLDDIFLLSRSTVSAQRATMLGVLSGIARRLPNVDELKSGMQELAGQKDDLRKRILAAGIAAMSEKGSLGLRAIEIVWQCIVGWNLMVVNVDGAELETTDDLAISSIPLEFFLPQVATLCSQEVLPKESQSQLLSILYRLAQQSNSIAGLIVSTPNLLSTIIHTFVSTPASFQGFAHPDPSALQLLHLLIASSRSNAVEVEKLADSFLRFITCLPQSAPYPPPLATTLLTWTLRLYRSLASYGLHTHVAGTAISELARIEQYIVSSNCTSYPLRVAWAELVEAWTTCATDPHQTTPTHEIKWSQIVGWSWDAGILELQNNLGVERKEWGAWQVSWGAQAAWLEGAKVNGVKGGESERESALESVKPLFEGGKAAEVVLDALKFVEEALGRGVESAMMAELSACFSILSSAIRLWLASIPAHLEGPPSTPPFSLPFSRLSALAAKLLSHPLWSYSTSHTSYAYIHLRNISQYLATYVWLSRRLPDVSQDLWMAQVFSILLKLGPGNEDAIEALLRAVTALIVPEWASARHIPSPPSIWEKGGFGAVLEPFLDHLLKPLPDLVVGPLTITPKSIKSSTTQRLPSQHKMQQLGLPLRRDWSMTPMNHLLRSADSDVFKALPFGWDFAEVEVTRAALFLTKVVQETLINLSLLPMVLTREEAIFRCMQVFMLEHGQTQNDSIQEVFRDATVATLMESLSQVYTFNDGLTFPSTLTQVDVEKVATQFLGPSVPFFQFYTDFVALYDAISFSHPLFASLLLTPTSMHYEVDYRKHLWCDFGHLLKTIRTIPDKVLTADLHEYLHPVERHGQVLGAYLNALLRGDVQELPRFVALHHVASTIWSDLADGGDYSDEKASMMFKALVQRGHNQLVRDVVRYRQGKAGFGQKVILPPHCCNGLNEDEKRVRKDAVAKWGGSNLLSKIEALL